MTTADIPAALALTALEDWGFDEADLRRLIDLEPQGCFVVDVDGDVVGLTTTTTYGAVAWLGNVIVHPDRRGQGLGEAVVRRALTFLDEADVDTVRLNAYPDLVPFYKRLGFEAEFETYRYVGTPLGRGADDVSPVRREDVEDVVTLDAASFGADRGKLLRRLFREFPDTSLVLRHGGEVRGYLVGNPGDASCEIAPWVCDPAVRGGPRRLLKHLVHSVGSMEYGLAVSSRNKAAVALADRERFAIAFRCVEMVRGAKDRAGKVEALFALGGLEKG
jgi:GNAT superfamily N-acetyltransferase